MPGGLRIHYPDLRKVRPEQPSPFEFEWEFWNGRDRERIGLRFSTNNNSDKPLILKEFLQFDGLFASSFANKPGVSAGTSGLV